MITEGVQSFIFLNDKKYKHLDCKVPTPNDIRSHLRLALPPYRDARQRATQRPHPPPGPYPLPGPDFTFLQGVSSPSWGTAPGLSAQPHRPQTLGAVGVSEPGVPGGVHATQVVQAVGGGHQGVDLALPALKLGQVVEAGHDGRDRLLDQDHELLGVHVLGLAGGGQGHGRVLLGLLVPRDDLVPEHGLQDAVHLLGKRRRQMPCQEVGFAFL